MSTPNYPCHILSFSVSRTETVEEYNPCVMEKGTQVKLWRGTWVIGGVIPFPAQQGASE